MNPLNLGPQGLTLIVSLMQMACHIHLAPLASTDTGSEDEACPSEMVQVWGLSGIGVRV